MRRARADARRVLADARRALAGLVIRWPGVARLPDG
jgi:hypothetical protein